MLVLFSCLLLKMRLSKERDSLSMTVKKLSRELAKVMILILKIWKISSTASLIKCALID